jgi:hypothetical protein
MFDWNKVIDKLLLGLFIATLMLLSYLVGTFVPSVVDGRLDGLEEVKCDDIISANNAYTGKRDLVCEVKMQQEDDNIHIYKGKGSIND